MLLIPAFNVFIRSDLTFDRNRTSWITVIVIFTLLVGLRHAVGGDWGNYMRHWYAVQDQTLSEVIGNTDPAYYLVNWVIFKLGGTMHGVNLVCAIVLMTGLMRFAERQPLPWLALAVSVPYLLVVVAMGYTRQSVALGFALHGLIALRDNAIRQFVLMIVLGTLFHRSCLLLLPIAALASTQNRVMTALWVGVCGAIVANAFLIDTADSLWENYVVAQYSSQGGLIRILMNAIPALILIIFRNQFRLQKSEKALWIWLSIFSLICIPLVMISSTAVDRVALYFIPLQVFVLSRLPLIAKNLQQVQLISISIVAYYALVMFIWLNFAAHAYAWLPYKNYLWSDDEYHFGTEYPEFDQYIPQNMPQRLSPN